MTFSRCPKMTILRTASIGKEGRCSFPDAQNVDHFDVYFQGMEGT